MNKQQFNKEVDTIFKTYNVVDNHIDTPFGKMYVRAEKSSNIELYSVFMRFVEDFDIELFYKVFSKHENINKFSKKWNIHNTDYDYVLTELDERLNNLQHLLSKYGKVDCKPLPEIFA